MLIEDRSAAICISKSNRPKSRREFPNRHSNAKGGPAILPDGHDRGRSPIDLFRGRIADLQEKLTLRICFSLNTENKVFYIRLDPKLADFIGTAGWGGRKFNAITRDTRSGVSFGRSADDFGDGCGSAFTISFCCVGPGVDDGSGEATTVAFETGGGLSPIGVSSATSSGRS